MCTANQADTQGSQQPPGCEQELQSHTHSLTKAYRASKMQEPASTPENSFLSKRLIFFGAAENKTEPALLQLFSQHGEVTDMFIVRSALGISSGCGHVTFAAAQQARAALDALKGTTNCAEPGSSLGLLVVEEGASGSACGSITGAAAGDDAASTVSGSSKSDMHGSSAQPNPQQDMRLSKTVFFTKVPPTVTQQQLQQLFSACGTVAHLELFIPWPGAKISRGCGLVEFASSKSAAAAVHSLHQAFTWPHSHSALVVEWVDRSRQNSNNKAKQSRAANGSMMGSPGDMSLGASLRAVDHMQGGSWRPAHGKVAPMAYNGHSHSMPQAQLMQLQQQAVGGGRNSHSCPLPQLPPGWQVIGTAQQLPPAARMNRPEGPGTQWAQAPTSLGAMAGHRTQQQAGPYMQQPQQQHLQQGVPAAGDVLDSQRALLMQQQLLQQRGGVCGSDTGSAGTWIACPVTAASTDYSSLTSLGSVYDTALLSSSTFSSAANSAANSGVLQPQFGWDGQQQHVKVLDLTGGAGGQELAPCSAAANASPGVGQVVGQQYSEPMLSVSAATAAAMGGGTALSSTNDPVLQQLLQQNVMLFQTMTPPPEDEPLPQHMLLQSSAAGPQQGLQATNMLANPPGTVTYMPLSQAQQMTAQHMTSGPAYYTSSSMLGHAQQRQQQLSPPLWYYQQGQAHVQQQQQQAAPAESSAVVALPLSQRQLAGMAGVLPEVPKLTGAQAWISSAASGGLQLCLSGTFTQLQAGHTAVAMLLGKAGIDEPLAPPVVHAAS